MRLLDTSNRLSSFAVLVGLAAWPALSSASDPGSSLTTPDLSLIDQHRGWGRRSSPPGGDPFSVENRQRIPWFVTLGAFFPNGDVPVFSGGGGGATQSVSGQVGTDISFGYRFPFKFGEGRLVARGSEFNYGGGSGNFGFGDSRNASIEEVDVDLLGRIEGFYAGIGAAFMNATLSSDFYSVSDNNTEVALAYTVGYDFTPRWFIEGRAHYTGVPFYSGESLSIGYRF